MKVIVAVCALLVAVVVEAGVPKHYPPGYESAGYHDTYTAAYAPYLNVSRECGIVPKVNRYFLQNKDDLAFSEYPWHAAIIDGEGRKFLCSGTLVSDYHVVTSASCIAHIPQSHLIVRVGEYDIRTVQNPVEVYKDLEVGVSAKFISPEYKDSSYGPYNVAVLALSSVIDFDRYPQIIPICLSDNVEDHGACYVAGWGESEVKRLRVDLEEPITVDLETVSFDLKFGSPKYEKISYEEHGPEYVSKEYSASSYDGSEKYKRSTPAYPYEAKPHYTYEPHIEEVPKYGYSADHTTAPVFLEDLSQTLDFAVVKKVDYHSSYDKDGGNLIVVDGVNGYRACKADVGSSYACTAKEYYPKYKRSADYQAYPTVKKSFETGPTSEEYGHRTRLVLSGIVVASTTCLPSSDQKGLVSTPGIGNDNLPYYPSYSNYDNKKAADSATVLDVKPSLKFILSVIGGHGY